MNKFWIACIGVYVCICGLFCCLLSFVAAFAPALPDGPPTQVATIFYSLFGVFLLALGVGIMRKKDWARLIFIGVCGFSILGALMMILILLFFFPAESRHIPANFKMVIALI